MSPKSLDQDSHSQSDVSRQYEIERNLATTAKILETLTAAIFTSAGTLKTIGPAVSNKADSLDRLATVNATSRDPVITQARHEQQRQCIERAKYFDFLGLPPEIRSMIYDLLIVDPAPGEAWRNVATKEQLPRLLCSLHLVCRVLSQEALAIFWRSPMLSLDLHLMGPLPSNPFASKNVKEVLTYPRLGAIKIMIDLTEAASNKEIVESIMVAMHHVIPIINRLTRFEYCLWGKVPEILRLMSDHGSEVRASETDYDLCLGVDMPFYWDGVPELRGPLATYIKVDFEMALNAYYESHGHVKKR